MVGGLKSAASEVRRISLADQGMDIMLGMYAVLVAPSGVDDGIHLGFEFAGTLFRNVGAVGALLPNYYK